MDAFDASFFNDYIGLPDLHSFPTRRSSDLHYDPSTGKYGVVIMNVMRVAGIVTDRKSTRLNSSHMSISYAVFCLKKKNVNLEALLQKNGRLSPQRVGRLIGQLCEVLQSAHD